MPSARRSPPDAYVPPTAINHAFWTRSPVGMARVGRDGTFLAVNPAFSAITGYSERELLQLRYQDITHPADVAADEAEANDLSATPGDEGYSMAKRYIRRDERVVWVELHVSALRTETDEFVCFVVFAVPLPNGATYRAEVRNDSVVVRPSFRWVDLIRDNPRESILLLAVLLGLVERQTLIDFIAGLFHR